MSAGVCSSWGEAGGACWVVNVPSVGVMSTRPLIICTSGGLADSSSFAEGL